MSREAYGPRCDRCGHAWTDHEPGGTCGVHVNHPSHTARCPPNCARCACTGFWHEGEHEA